MLISHEVPMCLLKESRIFNDYDYCLCHLLEQNESYYNFFKKSIKLGRLVILDNSVFELEKIFDSDKFAEHIIKLNPTEYVIPDSLENINETITSFDNFISKYKDLPGRKIGVVQGKTIKELQECYNYMNDKADKIAISFDYSCLIEGKDRTPCNFMRGRKKLLSGILKLNKKKPHHLLGCFLPQEFIEYRYRTNIHTIDTSNPIVHAIKGIKYTPEGLNSKISIKLAELINIPNEKIDRSLLYYNIYIFRKFLRG